MVALFKKHSRLPVIRTPTFSKLDGFSLTPLSQCPGGTFSLSGGENFYRNSNGDRKSIVSSSKIPVRMVLECNFFNSISNGD